MEPLSHDRNAFFRDAKAYLSSASHPGGGNLYDHVGELLLRLVEEKRSDPLEAFERVSFEVKQDAPPRRGTENVPHTATRSENREAREERDLFRTEEEVLDDAKAALRERRGFGPAGANEDDDEEVDAVELPEPNDGEYPDVLGDQRILEAAGTGLGPEESYALTLSVKRLVEAVPISKARFWGKILGIRRDYYIVESEFRDGDRPDSDGEDEDVPEDEDEDANGSDIGSDAEDADADDADGAGEGNLPRARKLVAPKVPKEKHFGCNRFTYWVSHGAAGEWTRLPAVTPEQIRLSRGIRRFFTGDLTAEVPSYPPFPGNEAELLRAQIARISHACSVAPRGMYALDEDADEDDEEAHAIVPAEDYEPLPADELAAEGLDAWVHTERKVLVQGRIVHWAPEENEDEDEDEDDEDDENAKEKEPKAPRPAYLDPEDAPERLAAVAEDDEIVPETIPAFSTRVCGSTCVRYGAVAIKSNLWPGATTVADGTGKVASIYIGNGVKFAAEPFTPAALPAVQPEPAESPEEEDPDHEEEKRIAQKNMRKEAGSDDEDDQDEESDEEDS